MAYPGGGGFDFDFAGQGANLAAVVANGGTRLCHAVPAGEWWLDAILDLPQEKDPQDANTVLVPNFAMHVICRGAYDGDEADMYDWFAGDTFVHSQTFAFTLRAAKDADFHLDKDGAPRAWPTMRAFADDLFRFGNAKRGGEDPSPWRIYEDDGVPVPNPVAQGRQAVLNMMYVYGMRKDGNLSPWLDLV